MKRLLVAVHDVTPAHAARCDKIFTLLDDLGVAGIALLVVPDWHGEWPLESHPRFLRDLRRRREAGAEIFLHGFRHDEAGHRRSLAQRIKVAGRTASSGEFMMLELGEARRRIDRGIEVLETCGLSPVGFVPPAWLFGPGTMSLLWERGLAITEGFWIIRDAASGRCLFAPALSWSTAKPWRSVATMGVAALRLRMERSRSVVRVAIHPPDIDVPSVARSLRATLERLLATREVVSYREALAAK